MGIANIINTSTSSGGGGGEIIRELVNSSDGQGLFFSNTGYIHLANNAAAEFGTNDFSIEFILNQTGEVGSSGGSIYQSATTVNNKFSIENHVSSNVVKLIFFNAVGAAAQYDLSYNMAADYNEPTHYVVSCDRSGNAVLYRNGTEVASVAIAASASTNLGDGVTSTAMIGNSGSGYTFLGGLYRFRTWNKALSHDEIDTCFQRADVPFADQYGSETKVIDSDFNGNLDGWNSSNSWNSQTNPSNNMVLAASGLNQACRTSTQLTAFKKYRVTYTASSVTGTPGFGYLTTAGTFTNLGTITAGTGNTLDFYYDSNYATKYFYIGAFSADAAVTLDDISVVQIGCVSDHDLAFANPTQSAMCQDRAGNSDGTMGGTIQQTQKIVQLNAVAARIGTSQGTPQDRELLLDKYLTFSDIYPQVVSSSTASEVTISGGNATSNGANIALRGSTHGTASSVRFRSGTTETLSINSAGQIEVASGNAHISSATQGSLGFGNIATNTYAKVEYDDTNGNFNINNTRAYPLRFLTDDTERLSITAAGLVDVRSGNLRIIGGNQLQLLNTANDTNVDVINSGGAGVAQLGLRVSGSEKVTITSAGKVAIGHSVPAADLDIDGGSSDASIRVGSDTGKWTLTNVRSNHALTLTDSDGTGEVLRVDTSGLATFATGIAFSQTNTSATGATTTSATLDHYEEGSWTPVVEGGTMTISISTSNTQARYTRIGDLVFIQCFLDITGTGDATGLRIAGLPFNAESGGYAFIGVNASGTTVTNPYARVQSGNDHVDFYKDAQTAMPQSEFGSGNLIFSGSYHVA